MAHCRSDAQGFPVISLIASLRADQVFVGANRGVGHRAFPLLSSTAFLLALVSLLSLPRKHIVQGFEQGSFTIAHLLFVADPVSAHA